MNRQQKIDRSTIVERVSGLCAGELDGEAVLMSVDQGRYFGMDPIGTRIWSLIGTPLAVSDICDQLRKEYKVTPEECERDVLVFLNELAEAKLLKVIDDTPA